MKNKIFAMVIAVVMLAAVMVPVFGVNAEAGSVAYEVKAPAGAVPGGTFTTTIVITENSGFSAATLGLTFDKDQLTFVMPEENDEGGYDTVKMAGLEVTYGDLTDGYQQMGFLGKSAKNDVTKTGDLIEITFKVSDSVKIGDEIEIKLSNPYESVNLAEEKLTDKATDCKFKVACTEHKWKEDYDVTEKATCTEDGSKCIKCSVCGVVKEGSTVTIPATGHRWEETSTTAANCTEKGYTSYKCANEGCTETKNDNYVDALGHLITEWTVTKEATVDAEGEKTGKCTRQGCGAEVTVKLGKLIPKDAPIEVESEAEVEVKYDDETPIAAETVVLVDKTAKDLSKAKVEEGKSVGAAFDVNVVIKEKDVPVNDVKFDKKFTMTMNVPAELEKFTDVKVVLVKEDGTTEDVKAEIKDGKATFAAVEGTYAFIGVAPKAADKTTGDAMSVVLFAIVALAAVAGAVVIGKKRFA